MKNKKKIVSMTAVTLVMGSAMATANASSDIVAKMREPMGVMKMERQGEKAAIESGNFETWKSYVEQSGDTEILDRINADNFARYAEAFRLREAGDVEGARAIMEELGCEEPARGEGGGFGGEMRGRSLSEADRSALKSALVNSDYSAWAAVMGRIEGDGAKTYLAEEKFNIIVRAYKLKASGDTSGAMTLLRNSDIRGWVLADEGMGGKGRGMGESGGVDQAALIQAYEDGDYEAWKSLMAPRGGKILELIDADNFARFAEAKLLQSSGKNEEAEAIMKELGLPFHDRSARHGRWANRE